MYRLFVRKLKESKRMCKNSKRVVVGHDYEQNRTIVLDTQCKSYACPTCAESIQRMHQARIIYGAKEYDHWKEKGYWSFVTLTSHENCQTFETSLKLLQTALPKWRKRMKRRYGNYGYVMIFETHKSGALHCHLLINCAVSKKWVRRHARAVGLGYMADVQKLGRPSAAGAYVSKYVSKSLSENRFPKRFKRVRYSHDWPELPDARASNIRDWLAIEKSRSQVVLHILAIQSTGSPVYVSRYLVGDVIPAEIAQELSINVI